MTNRKPPEQIMPPEPHDPYQLRSLEQILTMFDGGAFLQDVMKGLRDMAIELMDHRAEHGPKGCNGQMALTINMALGKSGDVKMGAQVKFTGPKKPPADAAAYVREDGQLTLYSPMLARMQGGVRDVPAFDPETGEIRDA